MSSINHSTNTINPSSDGVALNKLFNSVLNDLTALAAAHNQLVADFNAHATTTSAPVVVLTTVQ
jgi:hypothetical protein